MGRWNNKGPKALSLDGSEEKINYKCNGYCCLPKYYLTNGSELSWNCSWNICTTVFNFTFKLLMKIEKKCNASSEDLDRDHSPFKQNLTFSNTIVFHASSFWMLFLSTHFPSCSCSCLGMEFDPCRLEVLMHNTTFAFAWIFWPYVSYKQF